MPRKKKTPGYLLHKQSGQARVRIDGKDHMLGAYGSAESRTKYDKLIALWRSENQTGIDRESITIANLIIGYLKYAETYYRKDGATTSEVSSIRSALRKLKDRFRFLPASEFGPAKLKLVRQDMIDAGWVRTSINQQVRRINRMLAWAVEEELLLPSVWQSCLAVKSLSLGRSDAVEGEAVKPVPDENIEAVRKFVSRQVWGLIQIQLVSGMRPQEARLLRMSEVDQSDKACWEYLPARHKTQHLGKERRCYLNKHAQKILEPFLSTKTEDEYLFSPKDAYLESQERRGKGGTTPRADRKHVAEPRRTARDHYSKDSYRKAIQRACEIAFDMPQGLSTEEASDWRKENCWSPNQLRHNAATNLEREFGEDVARCILGHASKDTTRIYVEEDFEKAKQAIASRKS